MNDRGAQDQCISPLPETLPGAGRVLALDLGEKRTGVAVSDELRITVRPLAPLRQTSWKKLLEEVKELIDRENVAALVVGFPLRLDGSEGDAARRVREIVRRFKLSLALPIFLQDERLTSQAAEEKLKTDGIIRSAHRRELIDGEAAAIILADFLAAVERDAQNNYLAPKDISEF
jgi:putative Holliday junction resolvase